MLTVKDLRPGDLGEVLGLAGDSPARRNNLAVFGLVPGSEVRLLQRHPSFMVRIGERCWPSTARCGDIVVRRR